MKDPGCLFCTFGPKEFNQLRNVLTSFLFYLSVTNLLLLPLWTRIFSLGSALDGTFWEAFTAGDYDRLDLIGAIILCLLLALVLLTIGNALSATRVYLGNAYEVLLTVGAVCLGLGLLPYHNWYPALPNISTFTIIVLCPVLIIAAAIRFKIAPASTLIASQRLGLAGLPIVAIVFFNFLWGAYALKPEGGSIFYHRDLRPISDARTASPTRVLWFIMDELDERLLFDERPSDVKLPAFDRLKETSFYAGDVRPPWHFTYNSILAMLTGHRVVATDQIGSGTISVRYQGETGFKALKDLETVFSNFGKNGLNAAAFGQFAFNYCDLFHRQVSKCWNIDRWWNGSSDHVLTRVGKLTGRAMNFAWRIIQGRDRDTDFRMHYIAGLPAVWKALSETVADDRFDLVFAHLRVPHDPFVYDRNKNDYTAHADQELGYLDNLVLTGFVLGQALKSLKKSGHWDKTAIILTADHWWRNSKIYDGKVLKRVPLIVKMPNQSTSFNTNASLSNLGIGLVINSILNGTAKSPNDIVRILKSRPLKIK